MVLCIWSKLQVGDGTFEVFGFEPDFVSFGEGFEDAAGTEGHDLVSEFMGGKGFISCSVKGF